jgi:hypothetical protein
MRRWKGPCNQSFQPFFHSLFVFFFFFFTFFTFTFFPLLMTAVARQLSRIGLCV